LRQNSSASTARALKEHFIFERIAEEESIEEKPEDYDREIDLIAEQSGETSRRVRARLEKGGGMDMLRNQVIERKVVDLILSHAEFQEIPYVPDTTDAEAEAVQWSASGEQESSIPEIAPEASEPKAEGGEAKVEGGEAKVEGGEAKAEGGEA
jgi:trigger factor